MNEPTFSANPRIRVSTIDGQMVVLNLAQGGLYSLNAVAANIWAWLAQPRTVTELVDLLTSDFDVPPDVARADLQALLADFAIHGLLERS